MVGDLKDTPGVSGSHIRTRQPVPLLPCSLPGGGDACSAAWGGGKVCKTFHWSETQDCNEHLCPVDCEPHAWGAWTACTKTGFAKLHEQTDTCNQDVSCDAHALPQCQQ